MTEIIEPGTNVTANGYLGTVTAYDQHTDSYTVEIDVPASHVELVQAFEPREPGVYKLSLARGGTLVAQKLESGVRPWMLMGDRDYHAWPPVKGITDWERIA